MASIRKGDQVKVIAGKDKGVIGQVIEVVTGADRVVVEGVNRVSRHTRPTQTGETGGIVTVEAPIHVSNVMLVVDHDGAKTTTRLGSEFIDGAKTRISRRTGKEA